MPRVTLFQRPLALLLLGLMLLLPLTVRSDTATHALPDEQRKRQVWFGDALSAYVVSGCAPAVPSPGSLTFSSTNMGACEGYVRDTTTGELLYVPQVAAAVGPLNAGNGTYWLALHKDRTSAMGDWTRQAGTHYLWQLAGSQPADPSGGLVVAQSTVAGGAITAVSEVTTRLIVGTEVVSASRTVGNAGTWVVQPGGRVSLGGGSTLTFGGSLRVVDILQQVFTGTGVVRFPTSARQQLFLPEWWGAKADNTTDSTTAITAMLTALPTGTWGSTVPRLLFQPGIYKISGSPGPALTFAKSHTADWQGAVLDYGTGTGIAVRLGAATSQNLSYVIWRDGPYIKRTYSAGDPNVQLVGEGLRLQNVRDFRLYDTVTDGFKQGMRFYADGGGVSYGEIFAGAWVNNLQGTRFDGTATAGGFVTNIKFYGGRFVFSPTFTPVTNSRLIYIVSAGLPTRVDSIRFTDTVVESATVERKIDIDGDWCALTNLYYDVASSSGTDIVLQSPSKNNVILGGTAIHLQQIQDLAIQASSGNQIIDGLRYGPSSGGWTPYGTAGNGYILGEKRLGSSGSLVKDVLTNDGLSAVNTGVDQITRTNDTTATLRVMTSIQHRANAVGAGGVQGEIHLRTSTLGGGIADRLIIRDDAVFLDTLISTGAATGKTVVCADTTGRLFRSSSPTDCAN